MAEDTYKVDPQHGNVLRPARFNRQAESASEPDPDRPPPAGEETEPLATDEFTLAKKRRGGEIGEDLRNRAVNLIRAVQKIAEFEQKRPPGTLPKNTAYYNEWRIALQREDHPALARRILALTKLDINKRPTYIQALFDTFTAKYQDR